MEEKEIFKGKIFTLVQKEVEVNGFHTNRDIIHHPGGVGVLLMVDHKICFVSQFRHAIMQQTLEIPAGKLEYGENPKECGLRELNEEAGYEAEDLELIFAFVSTPGFCDEKIWIYKAIQPKETNHRLDLDEDEDIELCWMDIDEAYQKCMNGEIIDAKTILAIQHAKMEERER